MVFLLLLLAGAFSQTVPSLNVTAYYGKWVQIYSDYVVKDTFEKDLVCDSAYYFPYPNDTIAVVNSGNHNNANGNLSQVRGWASQDSAQQPGRLSVHLQATGGIGAPYWIYKLGPIVNDLYEYSIVSDDIKLTLFVLARNYTRFFRVYDSEVITWLFKNGFNGVLNSPIPTNQTNCM